MQAQVISLGGSVIIPEGINISFLRSFRTLLLQHIKKGSKFMVVCGGGNTARLYQKEATQILPLSSEDTDWLGIHASRLNAHLVRTLFAGVAMPRVVRNPSYKQKFSKPLIIGAGFKPGRSTDYLSVRFALTYGIRTIINISNITHVYDKDPAQHKDAKPLKRISWVDFRKLVGNTWSPGLNMPFDPIASRVAQKHGLQVKVVSTDIKNLDKVLHNQHFEGTVIE